MKKVVIQSWDVIPIPDTVIARVNALGQGKPNVIDFLDCKKCPIGEIYTTGVDDGKTESPQIYMIEPDTDPGETESPHIEMIETETDIDPILDGAETIT